MKRLWTILVAVGVAVGAFSVAPSVSAKIITKSWSCEREVGETKEDRTLSVEDRELIEKTVKKFQGVRGVRTTENSIAITYDNRFRSPPEMHRAVMDHGFRVDGASPDTVFKPRPEKKDDKLEEKGNTGETEKKSP